MGLPGFFVWLLKNTNKRDEIITKTLSENPDILYLDANCLFHPQCFAILRLHPTVTNIAKLEDLMIERIIKYIDYVVDLVKPKKGVYIAVDGVAPRSKMNQQRKRRFMSQEEQKNKNRIKEKYSKQIPAKWSNMAITPGTEFMELLTDAIRKHIRDYDIDVTFSSYHTPGEGEHKILQDIKKRNSEQESYVIYGLDADLIFLAMASQKDKIHLIREDSQISNSRKEQTEDPNVIFEIFNYVDIDKLKHFLYQELNTILGNAWTKKNQRATENLEQNIIGVEQVESLKPKFDPNNKQAIVNDFIFICYLLGNDFIPHPPSIDIKKGGLDVIIEVYISQILFNYMKKGTIEYLISITDNKPVINNRFFCELIRRLSFREDGYFTKVVPRHREIRKNKSCQSSDPYEIEIWNLDNLKFKIHDPIQFGIDCLENCKFKYYSHYYRVSEYQEQFIKQMCQSFLEGIIWVSHYYFDKCASWDWQYPYHHAPFLSDVSNFLWNYRIDMNSIEFEPSIPLEPFVQLLSVLPPFGAYLLPQSYRQLVQDERSPVIVYYPQRFGIDMVNKDMMWQCLPLIPNMNSDLLIPLTSKLKLTPSEKSRNKTGNAFTKK